LSRLRWLALALATGARLATAAPPAADAVLAELPFVDADAPPRVVRVDLAVPGATPLVLAVDPGSAESFATPLAARAIGITVRRNKATPYRRATRLGRDVSLWVDTRRGETAAARDGEWAVAGARFLAAFVLELDLPGRRVRFLDPRRFSVPERAACADEAVLPLDAGDDRPVVTIEVGRARVPAIVTTSAPGTLLLSGGFAAEAGVVPDPEATKALPPGSEALRAARAPRVRIGPFESTDVPVLVAERGADGSGPRGPARLGLGLLDDAVVRIDWSRHRLWIARSLDACAAAGDASGGPPR